MPTYLRNPVTFASGYARSVAESAAPELWRDLVTLHCPALGRTGGTSYDFGPYRRPIAAQVGNTWGISGGGVHLARGLLTDYTTLKNNGQGVFDNQSWTLFFYTTILTTANYSLLFSYDYTSHVPPYYACHLRVEWSNRLYLGWNNGGVVDAIISAHYTVPIGVPVVIAAVCENGRQELWVDGAVVASDAAASVITYYNQEVWVGRANFTSPMQAYHLYQFGYWRRAMTHREIRRLSADPYCMLRLAEPTAGVVGANRRVAGPLARSPVLVS